MKNWKLFIAVFGISLFFISCRGSKCDCPSFKPKGQVEMEMPVHAKVPQVQEAI